MPRVPAQGGVAGRTKTQRRLSDNPFAPWFLKSAGSEAEEEDTEPGEISCETQPEPDSNKSDVAHKLNESQLN